MIYEHPHWLPRPLQRPDHGAVFGGVSPPSHSPASPAQPLLHSALPFLWNLSPAVCDQCALCQVNQSVRMQNVNNSIPLLQPWNTKEGFGEIILMFLFIASYTSYDSKMITELSFCWFNKEQRGHLAPAAPWDVISHIISKVCHNCQSFLSSLHFPLPSRGLVWLQIRCHHTWLGWAGLGWAGLGSPIRVSNEACVGTMGPGRYAEIRYTPFRLELEKTLVPAHTLHLSWK